MLYLFQLKRTITKKRITDTDVRKISHQFLHYDATVDVQLVSAVGITLNKLVIGLMYSSKRSVIIGFFIEG